MCYVEPMATKPSMVSAKGGAGFRMKRVVPRSHRPSPLVGVGVFLFVVMVLFDLFGIFNRQLGKKWNLFDKN
jgi:hypothetical protein